jgi:hypothetical protein
LYAVTRIFSGGLISQAIAALENACLDLKAKDLNVPVHQLFGGALRKRLPIYWSQCGTLRSRFAPVFEAPPLRSLDDIVALGQEARTRGFKALKTNILSFENGTCSNYRPGFGIGTGFPASSGEVSIGGATGLSEQESVIADSVVLQHFAMSLAIKNKLNPDAPVGLLKVTQTI